MLLCKIIRLKLGYEIGYRMDNASGEKHACARYNRDFDVAGNSVEMNDSLVDFVGSSLLK